MSSYGKLISGRNTWVARVERSLTLLPENMEQYSCRNNQLIATAYDQISAEVNELKKVYGKNRIGVIIGTSTSGISEGEEALKSFKDNNVFPETFNYTKQEIGSSANFLAEYAGVTGINYVISTACSSSGKAFASAYRLIASDLCDVVIVGGSDSLCEMTLNGFDCLGLVSPDICKPFCENRSGLNIGEGAALFILSKEKSEIKLSGFGESSDGYHISTPDPSGDGAFKAMKKAIEMGGKESTDIGYVNLHGTATHKNDLMESYAMDKVFLHCPPCSSTKPLLGHTLGAAGAQELGLCWLLLSLDYNPEQIIPPQLGNQSQDIELQHLNIINSYVNLKKRVIMSNSFAFGGSNVSLLIEREDSY